MRQSLGAMSDVDVVRTVFKQAVSAQRISGPRRTCSKPKMCIGDWHLQQDEQGNLVAIHKDSGEPVIVALRPQLPDDPPTEGENHGLL